MRQGRSVDRAAWAEQIELLVARETRGNQTKFAKIIDVAPRTVGRWLKQEADVSEESVRMVARAFDIQPAELLVRVGYYKADEVEGIGADVDQSDETTQLIMSSELPYEDKVAILEHLREQEEADRLRRHDWVAKLIGMRRHA